jgi:hypothetical protein
MSINVDYAASIHCSRRHLSGQFHDFRQRLFSFFRDVQLVLFTVVLEKFIDEASKRLPDVI